MNRYVKVFGFGIARGGTSSETVFDHDKDYSITVNTSCVESVQHGLFYDVWCYKITMSSGCVYYSDTDWFGQEYALHG